MEIAFGLVFAAPGRKPRSAGVAAMRLYEEPQFTFRFDNDRLIPRIHLAGVEAGRRVSVFRIDPASGKHLGLLTTGTVGAGGWVDLAEPILVRAGEAFVAVPER